jgi:hypothetical protein
MTEPDAVYGRLCSPLVALCIVLSLLPPFAVGGAGINAEVESFGPVWK